MPSFALGAACLLAALILNEWTVVRLLNLHGGLEPPALRYTVWAFQLLAVVVGVRLVGRRTHIPRAYFLVIPTMVVALLASAEGLTRVALKRSRSPLRELSAERGWKTAGDVKLDYVDPAFGKVSVSTGRHGFRRFDDSVGTGSRIFVLGDSYTEATQVNNGEAYYDRAAATMPGSAVLAYGTGGYGSLQEYMVLDEHVDSIRPGVILWQLSANDFVNNDHFLETQSPLSSRMTRPYYEGGKVVNRFAGSGMASRYSRLVRFVDARIAMLRGHGFQAMDLERERKEYPEALERSIRTTAEIMRMAKARAGAVPVVGFTAEGDAFADSVFRALATQSGWDYVPGVIDSIASAKAAGATVDGLPRDGHWNAAGHAIAGRVIGRFLCSARSYLRCR